MTVIPLDDAAHSVLVRVRVVEAGYAHLSTTMRYMHLSPASLNQAIRLLKQAVAADSRTAANARGETGETAPASERNRKNHA